MFKVAAPAGNLHVNDVRDLCVVTLIKLISILDSLNPFKDVPTVDSSYKH